MTRWSAVSMPSVTPRQRSWGAAMQAPGPPSGPPWPSATSRPNTLSANTPLRQLFQEVSVENLTVLRIRVAASLVGRRRAHPAQGLPRRGGVGGQGRVLHGLADRAPL